MNKGRRIWLAVLSLCVLLCGSSVESMASAPEAQSDTDSQTTYRLTFYAGNQGDFSGVTVLPGISDRYHVEITEDRITIEQVEYKKVVPFNVLSYVSLPKDSKYYVKGIRRSGRDNNTVGEVSNSAFPVKGDQDFVVAYGIKGDMVPYQVNYRDSAGNTLAPSATYYGNVGDKPVVAFLYIEGYEPQAYNLTRTLQKDASKNEFTFVYRRAETGNTTTTTINDGTTVVTNPGTQTTEQGDGTTGTGGGTGTGGAGQGEAGEEAAENAEEGTENIVEEQVPLAPGDLMDLDDEQVPLANLQNLIINPDGKFVYGASILIGLCAAAALTAMGIIAWKKRRAGAYEELDNWELK